MSKETKSKKLNITIKSLIAALGIAVAAQSISVVLNPDTQEDTIIENEIPEDNNDLIVEDPVKDNEHEKPSTETENNGSASSEEDEDVIQPSDIKEETDNKDLNNNPEKDKHDNKDDGKHNHDNKDEDKEKPSDNKPEVHNHKFKNWKYYDEEREVNICEECGYQDYRKHKLKKSQLEYTSNNDGTHTVTETKECESCEYKSIDKKTSNCKLSNWFYNKLINKESRNCEFCGYEETREHEHKVPTNLVYKLDKTNLNGTHKLKATYTCDMCDEEIVLYKEESCDYTDWSKKDAVSCIRECKICSYDQVKQHDFKFVPNSVTTNATVGLHNILEKCNDCNHEKQVTVACTGDGNKYFHKEGNIVTERENCKECYDVCIQDPHNHTYGNYIAIDDGSHKRGCACGNESVEAHSYGSWVVTGNGTNTRTCENCNHVESVTHTCSLKDSIEACGTADCCYVIVTTCEVDGCTYESRVPVGHNFHVESNMFGSIYTCYDCGYSYEQTASMSSLSLNGNPEVQAVAYEERKNKQLVLR